MGKQHLGIEILISETKPRSLQISSMEPSPMDRESILQLCSRPPRNNQTLQLPLHLPLLF